MQPILAESAPHRGRALVYAVVLTVAASLAAAAAAFAPQPHRLRHGYHHRVYSGQCPYVYVVR